MTTREPLDRRPHAYPVGAWITADVLGYVLRVDLRPPTSWAGDVYRVTADGTLRRSY